VNIIKNILEMNVDEIKELVNTYNKTGEWTGEGGIGDMFDRLAELWNELGEE
jgi:hypothetical protein